MFSPDTHFLVVDDYSSMRRIICTALNEMGFTNIIEADDGSVAWQHLQDAKLAGKPIDIVIADWNMPLMNGIDLLKDIRKDEIYKKMPFIMVTAEGEQKQILEAVKSGCSEYIIKPFAPSMIKDKVTRVFDKMQTKAAAA